MLKHQTHSYRIGRVIGSEYGFYQAGLHVSGKFLVRFQKTEID